MGTIILVTGGCRSGKSNFALEYAEKISPHRLFIATCPVIDVEMTDRVDAHKKERNGRGWNTVEEEGDLAFILDREKNKYDVILIDCITLWVNNVLFKQGVEYLPREVSAEISALCQKWLDVAEQIGATLVCVTNEVGLGIVPENKLARLYRDVVGSCNQLIAARASEVYLVSCGISLRLKG